VADWHWEPVTDDLLDALPPAAMAAVRQVADELAIRESMIFLDGPAIHPIGASESDPILAFSPGT
jgi:hypothetical protein